MPAALNNSTDSPPESIEALRRARQQRSADSREAGRAMATNREGLREARLDRIEAGKAALWRVDLRLTQIVNGLLMLASIGFVVWQGWAFWAAGLAAAFAVGGMWGFARWMRPREERLRRHLVTLARHRRVCAACGYRLRGLAEHRCPECGLAFDPDDDRHILGQQTLHVFSGRARQVSAIVIVFVIFWTTALAGGEPWPIHVILAGGLLIAFLALHVSWIARARRSEAGHDGPTAPACPGCATPVAIGRAEVQRTCEACGRHLTCGDLFVRPDTRRLTDRRVLAVQFRSLLLRWAFLCAACGGLTILVTVDVLARRLIQLAPVGPFFFVVMSIPVVAYLIACGSVFRRVARGQQRRLKMLFALIGPRCGRCGADVTQLRIGIACSCCGATVKLVDVLG